MNNRTKTQNKDQQIDLGKKVLLALIIVPVIAVLVGTNTIINGFSPLYLSSSTSLLNGFVNNFAGHAFILIGAFVITAIIWDLTRDSWNTRL